MVELAHSSFDISNPSMRKFLVTGAHLEAMRAFKYIATGKTVGFTTATPPEWSKVHEIWNQDGLKV